MQQPITRCRLQRLGVGLFDDEALREMGLLHVILAGSNQQQSWEPQSLVMLFTPAGGT